MIIEIKLDRRIVINAIVRQLKLVNIITDFLNKLNASIDWILLMMMMVMVKKITENKRINQIIS